MLLRSLLIAALLAIGCRGTGTTSSTSPPPDDSSSDNPSTPPDQPPDTPPPPPPTAALAVAVTSHQNGQHITGSRTVTVSGTLAGAVTITAVSARIGTSE